MLSDKQHIMLGYPASLCSLLQVYRVHNAETDTTQELTASSLEEVPELGTPGVELVWNKCRIKGQMLPPTCATKDEQWPDMDTCCAQIAFKMNSSKDISGWKEHFERQVFAARCSCRCERMGKGTGYGTALIADSVGWQAAEACYICFHVPDDITQHISICILSILTHTCERLVIYCTHCFFRVSMMLQSLLNTPTNHAGRASSSPGRCSTP